MLEGVSVLELAQVLFEVLSEAEFQLRFQEIAHRITGSLGDRAHLLDLLPECGSLGPLWVLGGELRDLKGLSERVGPALIQVEHLVVL